MMFDIPVELFICGISLSLIFTAFGFMKNREGYRRHWVIMTTGMFIAIFALSTDNMIMGYSDPQIQDTIVTDDSIMQTTMNVTSGTSSIQLANTNFGAGERPVNIGSQLYLSKLSCIMIDLSKSGSPTGTATIGVFGGTDIVKQFGTMDVSTLTTSQKSYQWCLSGHDYWIIGLHQRVGIKYTTGTAGNGVNVYLDGTNPFDGTNSDRSTLSSGMAWTDVSSSDLRMVLTYEDSILTHDNTLTEPEPIFYEFTQMVKTVFMLIGGFVCIISVFLMRGED